jgi:hypothetical protein
VDKVNNNKVSEPQTVSLNAALGSYYSQVFKPVAETKLVSVPAKEIVIEK